MRPSKWPVIVMLVAANILVWLNAASNFYDEDTEQYSIPPITFSLDSFEGLPSHMVNDGLGQTRLLYHDYFDVHGYEYIPRDQVSSSSCVGQASACAVDFLGAVETKAGLRDIPPPPRASASWIYGSSREVGDIQNRGRGSYARLAVRSMEEVGFLYEDYYFMLDLDLRGDDPDRDKQFRTGVPDELEPVAALNRIAGYYKLRSYEDVRDAIANGMPVIVGSSVGFGRSDSVIWRDEDGFLSQPRFRFRGKYWNHAMCFVGVCDEGRRGVLCMNSWGMLWVGGPQRFGDEPLGSFWIDRDIVNKMVAHGDCFAIYGLVSEEEPQPVPPTAYLQIL